MFKIMTKIVVLGLLLAVCGFKAYGQVTASRHTAEPEMVFVEGGTFMMGCTPEQGRDCRDNEKPAHQVTVSSFYIGKYVVTQRQWRLLMGSNPRSSTLGDNYPVDLVTWNAARDFINRLNAVTGKKYRLPTEAEWEYAARGGAKSKAYKYSGSNKLDDVAWFLDNSGRGLHPVGTKQPNELGIYDMNGNVWEWCSDWAGEYPVSPQRDSKGPASGTYRVRRGGGWIVRADLCRVAYRSWGVPDDIVNMGTYGFRLALPME